MTAGEGDGAVVLDASALLAWLQDEPGADVVDPLLDGGLVSSLNWSEVLQKLRRHGGNPREVAALFETLGVTVEVATKQDAERAAALWDPAMPLSLADRFCLALAMRLGATAVTAERAWTSVDDVQVLVVRR